MKRFLISDRCIYVFIFCILLDSLGPLHEIMFLVSIPMFYRILFSKKIPCNKITLMDEPQQ